MKKSKLIVLFFLLLIGCKTIPSINQEAYKFAENIISYPAILKNLRNDSLLATKHFMNKNFNTTIENFIATLERQYDINDVTLQRYGYVISPESKEPDKPTDTYVIVYENKIGDHLHIIFKQINKKWKLAEIYIITPGDVF